MSNPGYTPEDSLVYVWRLVEVFRDRASDSVPDDDGRHSPYDELIWELADNLHEIAKVVRREAQAHGCAKAAHYSTGGLVVTPGKVWHPVELQNETLAHQTDARRETPLAGYLARELDQS